MGYAWSMNARLGGLESAWSMNARLGGLESAWSMGARLRGGWSPRGAYPTSRVSAVPCRDPKKSSAALTSSWVARKPL